MVGVLGQDLHGSPALPAATTAKHVEEDGRRRCPARRTGGGVGRREGAEGGAGVGGEGGGGVGDLGAVLGVGEGGGGGVDDLAAVLGVGGVGERGGGGVAVLGVGRRRGGSVGDVLVGRRRGGSGGDVLGGDVEGAGDGGRSRGGVEDGDGGGPWAWVLGWTRPAPDEAEEGEQFRPGEEAEEGEEVHGDRACRCVRGWALGEQGRERGAVSTVEQLGVSSEEFRGEGGKKYMGERKTVHGRMGLNSRGLGRQKSALVSDDDGDETSASGVGRRAGAGPGPAPAPSPTGGVQSVTT